MKTKRKVYNIINNCNLLQGLKARYHFHFHHLQLHFWTSLVLLVPIELHHHPPPPWHVSEVSYGDSVDLEWPSFVAQSEVDCVEPSGRVPTEFRFSTPPRVWSESRCWAAWIQTSPVAKSFDFLRPDVTVADKWIVGLFFQSVQV